MTSRTRSMWLRVGGLPDAEWDVLATLAQQQGMTKAQYCKVAILEAAYFNIIVPAPERVKQAEYRGYNKKKLWKQALTVRVTPTIHTWAHARAIQLGMPNASVLVAGIVQYAIRRRTDYTEVARQFRTSKVSRKAASRLLELLPQE